MKRKRSQAGRINKNNLKYVHVTLRGHHPEPPIPDGTDMGLVCPEEGDINNTKHTHIGLVWKEKPVMTKKKIIDFYKAEYGGEPDVKPHNTFRTLFGYHMGKSQKRPYPCKNLTLWGTTKEEMLDDLNSRDKNKRSTTQAKNEELINTPPRTLVNEGTIHISNYKRIKSNVDEYKRDNITDNRKPLGSSFTMTWFGDKIEEYKVDLTQKKKVSLLVLFKNTGCRQDRVFKKVTERIQSYLWTLHTKLDRNER